MVEDVAQDMRNRGAGNMNTTASCMSSPPPSSPLQIEDERHEEVKEVLPGAPPEFNEDRSRGKKEDLFGAFYATTRATAPPMLYSSASLLSPFSSTEQCSPGNPYALAVVNPFSGQRGAVKKLLRELHTALGKERVYLLNASTFAHPELLAERILQFAVMPLSSSCSSRKKRGMNEEEHLRETTMAQTGGARGKEKREKEWTNPPQKQPSRGTVVVAGGDGTISFVYSVLGKLVVPALGGPRSHRSRSRETRTSPRSSSAVERRPPAEEKSEMEWEGMLPALSVIPLGTGNDYANCMGFGAHYSGEKLWYPSSSSPPLPRSSASPHATSSSSYTSLPLWCCFEDTEEEEGEGLSCGIGGTRRAPPPRRREGEEGAPQQQQQQHGASPPPPLPAEKKTRAGCLGKGGILTKAPCYPFDRWDVCFFSLPIVLQAARQMTSTHEKEEAIETSTRNLVDSIQQTTTSPPLPSSSSPWPSSLEWAPTSMKCFSQAIHAVNWEEAERLQEAEVQYRARLHRLGKSFSHTTTKEKSCTEEENDDEEGAVEMSRESQDDTSNTAARPLPPLLPPSHVSLINYLGIGFDAYVATKFDQTRRAHPSLCRTRTTNKMVYGIQSIHGAIQCPSLSEEIPMICLPWTLPPSPEARHSCPEATAIPTFSTTKDNRLVGGVAPTTATPAGTPPLALTPYIALGLPSSAKALVVSNVDSYAAGCRPWRGEEKSRTTKGRREVVYTLPPPRGGGGGRDGDGGTVSWKGCPTRSHQVATTASLPPAPYPPGTLHCRSSPRYYVVHAVEQHGQPHLVREKVEERYGVGSCRALSSPVPTTCPPPSLFPIRLPPLRKVAVNDGLLEVQSMGGVLHYSTLQVGLSKANPLAQASEMLIFIRCTPLDILQACPEKQVEENEQCHEGTWSGCGRPPTKTHLSSSLHGMPEKVIHKNAKPIKLHRGGQRPLYVQVDGEAVTPIRSPMIIRVTRAKEEVWGRCARERVVRSAKPSTTS